MGKAETSSFLNLLERFLKHGWPVISSLTYASVLFEDGGDNQRKKLNINNLFPFLCYYYIHYYSGERILYLRFNY